MNINKKIISLLIISFFSISFNISNTNAEDDFDLSVLTELLNDTSSNGTETNNSNNQDTSSIKKPNNLENNKMSNEAQLKDKGTINIHKETNIEGNYDGIGYKGYDGYKEKGYDGYKEKGYDGYNGNVANELNIDYNLAGKATSTKEISVKKLPQTGPEHYLLLLLSLIVVGFVFYKKK